MMSDVHVGLQPNALNCPLSTRVHSQYTHHGQACLASIWCPSLTDPRKWASRSANVQQQLPTLSFHLHMPCCHFSRLLSSTAICKPSSAVCKTLGLSAGWPVVARIVTPCCPPAGEALAAMQFYAALADASLCAAGLPCSLLPGASCNGAGRVTALYASPPPLLCWVTTGRLSPASTLSVLYA
jgi:hypothetical protein